MPAFPLTLVGALILALPTGLTVSVPAQAESDPPVPAVLTFTVGEPAESTLGRFTPIDDVTTEHRGVTVDGLPIDASDPRASGVMTTRASGYSFESDDTGASVSTLSNRLVNDDGAWSGWSTYVTGNSWDGDAHYSTELVVLAGEGAYAGVTLIMSLTTDAWDRQTNWGVIVPSHDLPPIGDMLALPAE